MMDRHIATETAYKNGYAKGCADAKAELAELIRAKQEGRVFVLPCKVGDIVYLIDNANFLDVEPSVCSVVEDEIYEMGYGRTQSGELKWLFLVAESGLDFYDSDIGKTVFLTHEDAEKALVERSKQP